MISNRVFLILGSKFISEAEFIVGFKDSLLISNCEGFFKTGSSKSSSFSSFLGLKSCFFQIPHLPHQQQILLNYRRYQLQAI